MLIADRYTVTQTDFDAYITLAQASEISGIALATLRTYASRGDLKAVKAGFGRSNFTTRRWLHRYLAARNTKSVYGTVGYDLPPGYEAPPADLPPEDESTPHAWPTIR